MLGRVAVGDDPAAERGAARRMPLLREAFAEFLAANPNRKPSTVRLYRGQIRYCFGDWLARPLDTITRRDVEARFHVLTERHGWAIANHSTSLLRSAYRRPCADHPGLRNPVDLWLDAGGRYHRSVRRRISAPAEVLPRWKAGIEKEVIVPTTRDIFWFGFYTGMRLGEVFGLRWDHVDLPRGTFRIEETKTGVPLELPITRQLAAILARRRGEAGNGTGPAGPWVFPSTTSASGHAEELQHLYARIGRAAGTKFWFHGLRNAFITVAERELMLPRSLTKRLVNHARRDDVTESYAADWTIEQLRGPAQDIADRIETLARAVPDEAPPPRRCVFARLTRSGRGEGAGGVFRVRTAAPRRRRRGARPIFGCWYRVDLSPCVIWITRTPAARTGRAEDRRQDGETRPTEPRSRAAHPHDAHGPAAPARSREKATRPLTAVIRAAEPRRNPGGTPPVPGR